MSAHECCILGFSDSEDTTLLAGGDFVVTTGQKRRGTETRSFIFYLGLTDWEIDAICSG